MNNLSNEELKMMRQRAIGDNWSKEYISVFDELIATRELKGDQVPVALVDERQGSGGFCLTQHGRRLKLPHGAELFTAPQKPVVLPAHEDCQSCDRYYVDGMKAGWNFHEEGDNQGFIDSIERVQKDMREARKERGKNDV